MDFVVEVVAGWAGDGSVAPMTPTEVAVIGAGIVGLATAHTLERRGVSVTVYEQGQAGAGQSAGQSRLFRHAHDDPRMIDLAIAARAGWADWEDDFGTELIARDGTVALGVAVPGKLARLQQFPAVRARPIDTAELAERLPVLAPFDGPALFDPDGGAIRTRAAIAALRDRLLRPMVAEQVLSIDHTGAEVEVRSATGCARFRRVVVCAGRGTAVLAAGVGVSIPAAVSAHARVSFAVRADAPVRLAGLQDGGAFVADTATYATAYPDRRTYALGVGAGVPLSGDGIGCDARALARLVDRASRYVATALPGLDPAPVDHVHCWVTALPWSDDGIGIWQAGAVYLVVGNNMFKHAPALGAVLADCAAGDGVPTEFTPDAELGAPRKS